MSRAQVLVAATVLISGTSTFAALNNTLFLHHFDGPLGPVAAAPSLPADYAAGTATTVLVGGSINGTAPRFGGASYDTTAGGRAHYVANDGNFDFAQGTVEFWIKRLAPWHDNVYHGFFGVHESGVADFRIYQDGSNRLGFYAHGASSANIFGAEAVPATPTPNEWHHVAAVWDSATNFNAIFLDGVDLGGDFGGAVTPVSATYPAQMTIGAVQSGTGGGGFMYDEFRISNIARYTSNFTPPTAPFVVPEPMTLGFMGGLFLLASRRRT